MATKNNDIQKVKITTTTVNDYSQIIKAMINAANACKRLSAKGIDVSKMQRSILLIEDIAHAEYKKAVI